MRRGHPIQNGSPIGLPYEGWLASILLLVLLAVLTVLVGSWLAKARAAPALDLPEPRTSAAGDKLPPVVASLALAGRPRRTAREDPTNGAVRPLPERARGRMRTRGVSEEES